MALSAFDDKNAFPSERAVEQMLGTAAAAWKTLKGQLSEDCGPLAEEWAFASAKSGWSLRMKRGKRVIVYMTPCKGHFLASFALGENACEAATHADLPSDMLTVIAEAPRYAEGRGIRIQVRTLKDASAIRKLAAIKVAH